MRNLTGHDVFMALKFVKQIGVKDELIKFANYINNKYQGGPATDETTQEIGARLLFGLLSNCGDEAAEKAFFAFLAGPLEQEAKDLAEKDLLNLCEEVGAYIESIDRERWRAFFTSLSAAIKTTT